MEDRYAGPAGYVGVLAIGLGIFLLLRAGDKGTTSPIPAPSPVNPITANVPTTTPSPISQGQRTRFVQQFNEVVARLVPTQQPVIPPISMPDTPTAIPAPPGVQACLASNFSADVDGQGCVGFFCGIITLTNTGQTTCYIRGRPTMEYFDHAGESLTVAQDPMPPYAFGDQDPLNPDSAVVLQPGEKAQLLFRTASAQCGWDERVPFTATWVMELPDLSAPITLHPEFSFGACSEMLPIVAWFEVGTFRPAK